MIHMNLKRIEFRPRNTEPGNVGWAVNLWFLLFLCVLLCISLQLEIFRTASLQMEDALAASNLAAAVIDTEEYGRTHEILIPAERAYSLYKKALKGNLSLDENWESPAKQWMSGPVVIEDFIVYSVLEDRILVTGLKADGSLVSREGGLDSTYAPNGKKIEASGIYSEISFDVKGIFGLLHRARKNKLADVVNNAENI